LQKCRAKIQNFFKTATQQVMFCHLKLNYLIFYMRFEKLKNSSNTLFSLQITLNSAVS